MQYVTGLGVGQRYTPAELPAKCDMELSDRVSYSHCHTSNRAVAEGGWLWLLGRGKERKIGQNPGYQGAGEQIAKNPFWGGIKATGDKIAHNPSLQGPGTCDIVPLDFT